MSSTSGAFFVFFRSITVWLVARAAWGFPGLVGVVLTWRPLLYLGKISYGVYVYPPLVPTMMTWVAAGVPWAPARRSWGWAAVATAVTLALSSLSWLVMERPINNLQRHFENR